MTAKNDITGDQIKSKTSAKYRENYEKIFSKDKEPKTIPIETMKVHEDNDKR